MLLDRYLTTKRIGGKILHSVLKMLVLFSIALPLSASAYLETVRGKSFVRHGFCFQQNELLLHFMAFVRSAVVDFN